MFDFITDLDEYFCQRYAGYDKMCILKGYKMPVRQTSQVRNGKTYAYTRPESEMRLALQENKTDLLKQLKAKMSDKTFSFTFRTMNFFTRIRNRKFYKGAVTAVKETFKKYGLSGETLPEGVAIDPQIWQNICKDKFLPSKNLIFTLALTAHFSVGDTQMLLEACDYAFDFAIEKDVVVAYLLEQKMFNRDMIDAALKEYKVAHLFLK